MVQCLPPSLVNVGNEYVSSDFHESASDLLMFNPPPWSMSGTGPFFFYALHPKVDDSMSVPGAGGGLLGHGECIEVLALPLKRSQDFVLDGRLPKSPGETSEPLGFRKGNPVTDTFLEGGMGMKQQSEV